MEHQVRISSFIAQFYRLQKENQFFMHLVCIRSRLMMMVTAFDTGFLYYNRVPKIGTKVLVEIYLAA